MCRFSSGGFPGGLGGDVGEETEETTVPPWLDFSVSALLFQRARLEKPQRQKTAKPKAMATRLAGFINGLRYLSALAFAA